MFDNTSGYTPIIFRHKAPDDNIAIDKSVDKKIIRGYTENRKSSGRLQVSQTTGATARRMALNYSYEKK